MELGVSLPCSQEPAAGVYPELDESNANPRPISLRSILILSSRVRLGLSSGLFPQVFAPKSCLHSPSLPCMLHGLLISSSLTSSFSENYYVLQTVWCYIIAGLDKASLNVWFVNTWNQPYNNRRIVGRVVFSAVRVVLKESRLLFINRNYQQYWIDK
jgi:hypothetical protein